MIEIPNEKTVTVRMKRGELCRLLVLIDQFQMGSTSASSWKALHDKLKIQLENFDEKNREV